MPTPSLAQDQALEAPDGRPNVALIRFCVIPADIERSVRFYRDVLGYDVVFDGDIEHPTNRIVLGLEPEEKARFIILRSDKQIDGQDVSTIGIGLLTIEGRDDIPNANMPNDNSIAAGQAMLAMRTDDMDGLVERATAFGAIMPVAPVETQTKRGTEYELVILDPDGVRMHVVQVIPPEPKPEPEAGV
ncbi:VOC family protein [Altererythrobacter sp. MF3-039]|uniref:VOC family protein n=1 Tax=Altererythrobacter sp. MF3-039 TaxID=3252901 RepID=UPI00390C8345